MESGTRAAVALAGVLLVVAAIAAWPAAASAAVERIDLGAAGNRPDGLFVVQPARAELDMQPGSTTTIGVTLTNRTEQSLDVDLSTTDLEAASEEEQLVRIVDEGTFGAGAWLTPEVRKLRMDSMEQVKLELRIDAPRNAPVGSNLAGLQVNATPVETQELTGPGAKVEVRGLAQVFITIDGEIINDTVIKSASISDTWVIGSRRFIAYELEYENRGNVNDHVDGSIVVRSLFGNVVRRIELSDQLIVLRGSTRKERVIWTDSPAFGRFSATAELQLDEGELSHKFDPVVILPPWWVLALLAGSLTIPVILTIRARRNSWKQYLDEDDDWDDDAYAEEGWEDYSHS